MIGRNGCPVALAIDSGVEHLGAPPAGPSVMASRYLQKPSETAQGKRADRCARRTHPPRREPKSDTTSGRTINQLLVTTEPE